MKLYCDTKVTNGIFKVGIYRIKVDLSKTTPTKPAEVADDLAERLLRDMGSCVFEYNPNPIKPEESIPVKNEPTIEPKPEIAEQEESNENPEKPDYSSMKRNALWGIVKNIPDFHLSYRDATKKKILEYLKG